MAFMQDVDEMEDFYTSTIINSLDEVAPMVWRKIKDKKHRLPKDVQEQLKIRNDLHDKHKIAEKNLINRIDIMGSCEKTIQMLKL